MSEYNIILASELKQISKKAHADKDIVKKIMNLCKKEAEKGNSSALYTGDYMNHNLIINIFKEYGYSAERVGPDDDIKISW